MKADLDTSFSEIVENEVMSCDILSSDRLPADSIVFDVVCNFSDLELMILARDCGLILLDYKKGSECYNKKEQLVIDVQQEAMAWAVYSIDEQSYNFDTSELKTKFCKLAKEYIAQIIDSARIDIAS